MLRAGPFSDERVIGLCNRRFVPFFFDLSNAGAAGDAKAREFVVGMKKELGSRMVSTPPVLVCTPEGEVLAEIDNYASEDVVFRRLRKVLAKHPEFAVPDAAEVAVTEPSAKAKLAMDLGDYEAAITALTDATGDAARLLRVRALRLAGKSEGIAAELDAVTAADFAADVALERALLARQAGDHARVQQLLQEFPATHARFSEARYHLGLARFHQDAIDDARTSWKELVTTAPQDRWVYRADWAWSVAKQQKLQRAFATGGKGTLLGRIGYMGRPHPDLAR